MARIRFQGQPSPSTTSPPSKSTSASQVELALWDTERLEDDCRLRPLSYPDMEVILKCVSIDSPDSLKNNPGSGRMEVPQFSLSVPISSLRGTKRTYATTRTRFRRGPR
ncbi:hypothetical protein HPB49_014458 [Dermacentor silvarum]|uniref:Uncharacterized protein n=1 Tax=Dermacentor silvarum TaxID=543639 RepID=A0ACB8E174_DERSI|nr:hypothetical protein HPB49_014458 [Dermacentor silvarum]